MLEDKQTKQKKNASAAATTTPVKVSRAPHQRKTCFLFIFACVSPARFFGKTKVGHLLLWAIKRNMFLFFLLFVVIAVSGDRFVIFCFHCHSAVHENVTVPKYFCHWEIWLRLRFFSPHHPVNVFFYSFKSIIYISSFIHLLFVGIPVLGGLLRTSWLGLKHFEGGNWIY